MKQVLEDLRDGRVYVDEVPAPAVRDGFVQVASVYSLISSGTEASTIRLGQKGLLGKALARPDQAMKVLQVARAQGVLTAYTAATRALEAPIALGYSCVGRVTAVGRDITTFQLGDLVACAGQGFASHAEIISVPKHLCARVPDGVAPRSAAFTTVGAIALQSLRVADVRLGERVVVIGLGLVGCLVAQLLRAAGCEVFGIDVNASRVELVAARGWARTVALDDGNALEAVLEFTDGAGADAVIVTASTDDAGPVALAGTLCRRKGRVVVVGRTPIEGPRETYLFKELSLLTSMAYGPGTGDPAYEIDGHDYPLAYVRWTEQRNMAAFLQQLADGRVDTDALTTHEFPLDEAVAAFAQVTGPGAARSLAVLLRYADGAVSAPRVPLARAPAPAPTAGHGTLRVGVIGAGSFAGNELVPLLASIPGISLRGIASTTGVRSAAIGKRFRFAYCASDAAEIIGDADTDAVLVLTRHDTHASLAADALAAGKHVLVEKPLALTDAALDRVDAAWRASGRVLMVGFNRRHAPLALELRQRFAQRAQPLSIAYRVNVGYRPPEHWLHHPLEGGGVILGEACHQIDFCHWLVGSRATRVEVATMQGRGGGYVPADNVHIGLQFADGSIATIVYVSNGSKLFATERVEVTGDNTMCVLEDWRRLEYPARWHVAQRRLWLKSDKGHRGQLEAFVGAARGGEPVDTDGYLHSSRLAIDAARQSVEPR